LFVHVNDQAEAKDVILRSTKSDNMMRRIPAKEVRREEEFRSRRRIGD
jgi:hypothetical protein